ncbi:MAG: alpha-glucan family phosphorylase [Chrysiogenetes bacterium]|nr:alpha-glucan family phosphorylase [Chrysiogenetes bacterium]
MDEYVSHTRELLHELAQNVRWAWSGEFSELFSEIDVDLWRHTNHNPTFFLAEVSPECIETVAHNPHYRVRLERACRTFRDYLGSTSNWATTNAPGLGAQPVVYFCAEFGLHESVPIYSGGLGILAGDHLKSASDLGVPLQGVGILYKQGYFIQELDRHGAQSEHYVDTPLERTAVERICDGQGKQLEVRFPVNDHEMVVRLWRCNVGRAPLILLEGNLVPDTNDHAFNSRLYGGDQRTRILQEIMLGIGGHKAIRLLGIHPGVIHLNEGHSAFAVLESIAECMELEGLPFTEASWRVRERTVFTTHTPVEAGHDRFDPGLVLNLLRKLRERLHLSEHDFLGLGRINPDDQGEPFCMTVLALKLSNHANAVSSLHGHVSRKMWQGLWPQRTRDEVPIGHITNGVHVPSWIAQPMARFFSRDLGEDWPTHLCHPDTWSRAGKMDPFDLWDVTNLLKRELLHFLDRRTERRDERLGDGVSQPSGFDPEALTIAFARRIVPYKRPTLLFRDPDRLAKLLNNPERPVQILFAGKAHPNDDRGKALIREIHDISHDPRFEGRVMFLENYDMNVSRHLLQGCDVWFNCPRRPYEACGTSGMKAVFNGTLNLSVLDGWWAEAYDGRNGYAFGRGLTHTDPHYQDERDGDDLYRVLEEQVIPDFYDRSPEGVPLRWVERMSRALITLGWRYNSDRMVMDYVREYYLRAAGTLTAAYPEGHE